MAQSAIQLPPDSTGKKQRTYEKSTAGHDTYVIQTTRRAIGGRFASGTWATATVSAAAVQNFATIANATGSAVLVAIQSAVVTAIRTSTTAWTTTTPIRLWAPSTVVPSGGTVMTKHKLDTNGGESASQVTVLGATSADNVASAITHALPATNPFSSALYTPTLTGAGQFLGDPNRLFTLLGEDDPPLILRPGESCLVNTQTNQNSGSTILTVEFIWEEFSYI